MSPARHSAVNFASCTRKTEDEVSLNDEHAYHVVEESGKFRVIDPQGQSIMVCHDDQSADHYASMLTKAFRQGYRTGFRDARRSKDAQ